MAQGPERQYTDRLLRALRLLPFSEWDKIGAGPWQPPGLPDIIGCVHRVYVAVEVKEASRKTEPRGGLTEKQQAKLARLRSAGAVVVLVYTSNDPTTAATEIATAVRRAALETLNGGEEQT